MSYHSAQNPEDDLPDWLRALRKRQEQESTDSSESEDASGDSTDPAEEPEPAQDPDWLSEIRLRYQRGKEPAEAAAEEGHLDDTKPRRLRAMGNALAPGELEPPADQEDAGPARLRGGDKSVQQEEAQLPPENFFEESATPSRTPAFSEDEPSITPGELPGWLQALRPGDFPKEDSRSEEMLPGSAEGGPLAGLSDVLPADPSITQVERAPVFSSRLEITENQGLHAAAFTKLLREVEGPPEDEARRVARPTRVLNIGIAAVLFLSVLFPLLTRSQSAVRPDPQFFPETTSVYSMIDVLPAGAPVLVAFEIQPALFGEMAPLVSVVFAHLLERQANLVFISTRPAGPALAERLLQDQFAASPAVATGTYTQLGYLSGGMAALRSFIADPRSAVLSTASVDDPWQSPTLEPVRQLFDFALILVVSSSAEDGRAWIEQSADLLPGGLAGVTSAQASPLLRVYLHSKPQTLHGLVSGLQGAALYERLRGQETGLGRTYWDAYSYGLGAIVLMILLGGLYGRLIKLKPEKPAAAEVQRGA